MASYIFTSRTAFRTLRDFDEMKDYMELIECAMEDRHEHFLEVWCTSLDDQFAQITGSRFGLVRPLSADLLEVLYVFRHLQK